MEGSKSVKFVNAFSLKSFLLYGNMYRNVCNFYWLCHPKYGIEILAYTGII